MVMGMRFLMSSMKMVIIFELTIIIRKESNNMGKGKPKWSSLPSRERFARKVKSWGFSDYIVNRIRESNSKDKTDKS